MHPFEGMLSEMLCIEIFGHKSEQEIRLIYDQSFKQHQISAAES